MCRKFRSITCGSKAIQKTKSIVIPHTRSFAILKEEAQQTFDFAIVIAYAVPWLKHSLKQLQPGQPIPFRPDYFDSRPVAHAKVRESCREYKKSLARHIFFSSFSFFEAYFGNVLREILDFHDRTRLLGKTELSSHTLTPSASGLASKRKLQEYPSAQNVDRYRSHRTKLELEGYHFPSALLSHYGLRRLIELVDGDSIRAVDIPELARDVLHLPLDQTAEVDVFHGYRETRNRIAHGTASSTDFDISKAVTANDFLRNLALKIDRQVVDFFLIVEYTD